jgi:hypothetical protein
VSAWPDGITVGPIREWPGTLTPWTQRKQSPFGATLTKTLDELDREVYQLADTEAQLNSVELLVAIPADQFRLDGKPRAQAKAEHPGVILSLDSRHGHLSYPCDTFLTWQDNLRAVVLALESLRRVDRYGVSRHGEQYRGYAAIESGPTAWTGLDQAWADLERISGVSADAVKAKPRAALRIAKRNAHPDTGGSRGEWEIVTITERVLREAGCLP